MNWSRRPLGELADTIAVGPFGSSIKVETFVDSGVPIISGQHLRGVYVSDSPGHNFLAEEHASSLKRAQVFPGDVILTHAGTIGQVSLIPESAQYPKYVISQRQFYVRCRRDTLDPAFLTYYLRSDEGQHSLLANASYSGVPSIAQPSTYARTLQIPLPPLAEQQAIAEVLGALDDKIAANTALAATAEITIATAYIAALRGDVSERPLLNELVIEFGEPFGGAQFSEPGLGRPLIRIRDLKTFKSQVWSTESRLKEVVVAAGDVLVGMDAEFRATPWLGEAGLLNQRVLRARHATFGRALVREMLRRPLAEIEGEKSATTVIHLNKADLARKTVDVPDADSITAFERVAEPLYEVRVALAAENRTLAATRDALLPQLMSGKLRVRDAERVASEVGA